MDGSTHSSFRGSLTPRREPESYLRAEIAAAPLTRECAFLDVLTALDTELDEGTAAGRATRQLWRNCAGHASWRSPKTRDGDRRKRAMAITENAASRSPKTRIAIGGRTIPRELTEV